MHAKPHVISTETGCVPAILAMTGRKVLLGAEALQHLRERAAGVAFGSLESPDATLWSLCTMASWRGIVEKTGMASCVC